MSIASINDLLAALPSAQRTQFYKASATTKGAGFYHSTWTLAGEPGAGAAAGVLLTGAAPTYTTAGAMKIRNPGAGNTMYIAGADILGGANPAALILYDRIWHNSEAVGNSTSDQTITSTAWTRSTDGLGTELWLEVYSAFGNTNTTFTVTYTNTDNTASRVATLAYTGGTPVAGQAMRIPLQAGDSGLLSIQKVSLTPSTGSAGNFGLTVAKRLCTIGLPTTAGDKRDWYQLGLPTVSSSACIAGFLACSGTTIAGSYVDLLLAEG